MYEENDELYIQNLHTFENNHPCLAMEAGICVNDMLRGINSEYFMPGVEMQDVIDMIELSGKYVLLHFRRFHKKLDNNNNILVKSKQHNYIQILLDQGVILPNQIDYTTKLLNGLKDRLFRWNDAAISVRIDAWKLYTGIILHETNNDNNNVNTFFQNFIHAGITASMSNIGNEEYLSTNRRRSWDPSKMQSQTQNPINIQGMKHIRPGISMRIIRAEEKTDHVIYIIGVLDIKSGAEWTVKKRFREFNEFRDVSFFYYLFHSKYN